ncbi:MAG TPA: dihydrodipicolinate synthase family protein [Candidatus Hydrogenedentes bacterium]|jgi:dihydrodipicolinate synthase/N-acetylneuraminate lyase|nr:MAG: 4-hydroxy-tetrahydrodipicolinate synthase [Candidatus Hydrogenedentes bacterium ADurb.Bin170]HQB04215.1 dihydrodipicolinate synthase family protein [Candidatus Hydrogenedentota bacterium]
MPYSLDYIYGAISPTFTVFHEDGRLDDDGQRRFVDFLLQDNAISAYFVRSGMGLMYTFSMEDTLQIARNMCAHLKGIRPVLVGCSGIWDRNYDKRPDPDLYLQQGIKLGNETLEMGAAAAVYTIPEALVPKEGQSHQDLIETYFTTLCAQVNGPVMVYQPPGTRKEYEIAPEVLRRLTALPNFVAGKFSTSEGYYAYELQRAVRGCDFRYIVGNETMLYIGVMLGSRACIGQGAIINPQMLNALVDRYLTGNHAGVLAAQDAINNLLKPNIHAVEFLKRYATEKGFDTPLYSRSQKTNPYASDRAAMTEGEYQNFKKLYELEMQAFR